MKKKIFLLTALGFTTGLLPIHASHVQGGEDVTIDQPVEKNLYVAGANIKINAPVNGDVTGAGGEIWINDIVNADVTVAGGKLRINNQVGGDVRIAGGEVTITNNVLGDLMITGGELKIERGVVIEGDVHIAGGKVVFDGIAKGEMRMMGGEIIFHGIAEHGLMIKGGKLHFDGEVKGTSELAAEEINLGSNARFAGDVAYWTKDKKINFDPYLQNSASAKYDEHLKFETRLNERWVRGGIAGFMIYRLLSAALLITLLISFFDKFFSKNTGQLREHLGNYIGTGSAFIFGVPILAGLAFVTIIGIPVGLIMMGSYGVAMTLAGSLTAIIAAYELEKYLKRDWSKGAMIAVSIATFAVLKLVGMMAFPGKLIVFAVTLLAVGAVIQWLRQGWRKPDEEPQSDASGTSTDSDIV